MKQYNSVEEYFADCPENIRVILQKIRVLVKEEAPNAVECIAYGMPAYKLKGKPLVYYAAFKNHIGFYALPSGNEAFKEELKKYKTGKGSIQFQLNEEIPYNLIRQIVEFRVAESEMKF